MCKRTEAERLAPPETHRVPLEPTPALLREADMVLRVLGGESMAEVARDYGLSRERVRQLVGRHGVTHTTVPGGRPLDPDEFRRRVGPRIYRTVHRRAQHRARQQWRRWSVGVLRTLAQQLGRTPSYAETARACGLRPKEGRPAAMQAAHLILSLAMRWSSRPNQRRKIRCLHRLYRLAGLVPRKSGERLCSAS